MSERIQKILRDSGVGSRRTVEQLIIKNRITVNGNLAKLGDKISYEDTVKIDGKVIVLTPLEEKIYLLLNKPKRIITSTVDPEGRLTVIDIIPLELQSKHLIPVGRLDFLSSGLIILTNDTSLMNELVGPKSNLEKEYVVTVRGKLTNKELLPIKRGLRLDDVSYRPAMATILSHDNQVTRLSIIIKEGKNHEIRNMMKALGKEVLALERVRIGHLEDRSLKQGQFKYIKTYDINKLRRDSKNEV